MNKTITALRRFWRCCSLAPAVLGLFGSLVAVTLFSGCTSFSPDGAQRAAPGQAVYHYKKGADGTCEVVITSGREVPGLEANVDKNCAVTVKAEALSGQKMQMQMMETMTGLVDRIPVIGK